jgi:uncharacterized membrane protein YphA (DoxX/SURF4 family)
LQGKRDMQDVLTWNRRFGMLGVRLVIGTLSMLLGYHKIFTEGLDAQFKWFVDLELWFPIPVLVFVNYYAAYVELIAGLLVFIGLFRDWALYLILSVLVVVTIGHSLEHTVWDIQQLIFRLAAVVTLLLAPCGWDMLRADSLFRLTRRIAGLDQRPTA